jgi:hypothetical protein
MNAIQIALELPESTREGGVNPMQWQRIFIFSQFPRYGSATKSSKIKTDVTPMFSHFLVTS